MSLISAEMDIALSMRQYFTNNISYPELFGFSEVPPKTTVTGYEGNRPYGDVYAPGDTLLEAGLPGQLGEMYYVTASTPGDPTVEVQSEAIENARSPHVVLVTNAQMPEVKEGRSVYIGIRLHPSARTNLTRQLYGGREISQDRGAVIITEPFYKGNLYFHVEGRDKLETSYVYEQLNRRNEFRTYLYKFDVRVTPRISEVRNLEIRGIFKNVLSCEVRAVATDATPYNDLPDGMPPIWFANEDMTGFTAVLEHWQGAIPRYAEKMLDVAFEEIPDA